MVPPGNSNGNRVEPTIDIRKVGYAPRPLKRRNSLKKCDVSDDDDETLADDTTTTLMTTTYQFKRQRRISPPEQATILMADLMKVVHSSSTLANNNPSQTSVLHSLLRQARRLVSSKPAGYDVSDNETNEIIGKFLSHGLAYVLLQILQSADTKQSTDASILHESLWILVNITASSQHTLSAVTIAHLVPLVANLLFYMHSPHVREQSIWFLAHLAGNDTATRDMLLQSPRVVRGIVYNLESPHNLAILCRSAWAVSNLVQQGNPASKPAPEAILPFLPSVLYNFTYGVQHRVPVEDLLDYVAVIQSLVQNSSMTRQAIVLYKNGEIIQTLGQLIATYGKVVQAAELLCPTCRILGQYAAGTPQETDAVIQCGFLKRSLALLKHMSNTVQRDAMFCLSNIAGGTVAQIQTIMDEPGLFKKILQMADGSHYLVQHEAFWVIANVINTGSLAQAKLTVPFKSIRTLCEYIPRSRDKKILSLVLKTIEKLLSYRLDLPGCCERVQECKGVDDLERLLLDSNMNKDAQNNQVYATAERILTTFFGNESEQEEDASDEQNCSPAIGYKLAAGHETDNVFSNNNISHSNEGFVAEASPPPSKQLFPELSHSTRYLQQRQHQGQQYPYPSGERSLW